MNFKNLPLYRIVVDPNEEETGMTCISLVDDPAIEVNFLAFNKHEKLAFAVQDEAKRIVTGPAIINGMPIYRRSPEMGEYMVVFDEQTIDNIILKYSKFNMWNNVSLQHDGQNVENVIMVEYFKKDSGKGIVPKGFEDVADGSLFVSYKVLDDDLWNQIVNGDDLNGFSIEVNADLEPTDQFVDDGYEVDPEEMDVWDLLEAILGDDVELLWSSEKKKFASDLSVIEKAIDGEKELSIKYGDRTVKGTPYSIFDNRGSRNVVLYDGKEWRILNEKNIVNVTETGNKGLVNWGEAIKQPDFGWVTERIDKAVEVDNINPNIPKNEYERAVVEHRPAMCTYIDEVGRETGICVGNRQVQTMEIGFTRKGNACLRVYQHFGPTHHTDDPIPAWRNLRLDRIRSFKIVDWLEPYTNAPIGFNETGPDRDGFTCTLRSDLKIG